jgi:rubrerythrin
MPADDRTRLVRQLQGACSGELAAGYAYRGHWRSLRAGAVRDRIQLIEQEEWHHRDLVHGLLGDLGAAPNRVREAIFYAIGLTIGMLCRVGGRFIPMYGAGRLERWNVIEYETAAEYAVGCGHEEMIECLLRMADVEREHERFFREQVEGHPLLKVFRMWEVPPERVERIRI